MRECCLAVPVSYFSSETSDQGSSAYLHHTVVVSDAISLLVRECSSDRVSVVHQGSSEVAASIR